MAERMEKLIAGYTPFPMCIVNSKGKVTRASASIDQVFIYTGIKDADIFALTGIKYEDLEKEARGETTLTIARNDRRFRVKAAVLKEGDHPVMAVFFNDVTEYEELKEKYAAGQICMAVVNVDNYDELLAVVPDELEYAVTSEIDKVVRTWAARMNAAIMRVSDRQYLVVTDLAAVEKQIETKFPVLDEARKIVTEADFPVTLSIGVGVTGKTMAQTEQHALDALDFALGRGGDQAVIKRGDKLEYYGGTTQTVEKSNKGKSRIVAHALGQLVSASDRVLVMGHKNPDMDSLGAAIGIHRFARKLDKDAFIVTAGLNEGVEVMYRQAEDTDEYRFITPEKALALAGDDTLVVVVDTNRKAMTECPELLDATDRIAVIDHHRRSEDSIDTATLSYVESYASSACELIAEMLQSMSDKKTMPKFEAEALLAGITLDTNRFAIKTGVRTFDAAAWLRRQGADPSTVQKFFQTGVEMLKLKSECISEAVINDSIAMARLKGKHLNAKIIISQVADELLEIKGLSASFVAGEDTDGTTAISARSVGDMNVQTIMENFGGGGHMNAAGAQVTVPPDEALAAVRDILDNNRTREENRK